MRLDDLLAHARWANGFARMLVRDGADDLAQDAWLAAIRTPPAADTRPRAWLARVMRNAARMRYRGETRRKAREERASNDVPPPTPLDAVHRMRLQRQLAELVLALDEPRRSVVVLAFYDGKSAAEIGRELALPATTVRSRIASALDTIRAQLDADAGGDRSKWQLALAPLVHVPLPSATAGVGGTAIAAVAVCIALAVGLVLIAPHRETGHPVVEASRVERVDRAAPRAVSPLATKNTTARVDVPRDDGAAKPETREAFYQRVFRSATARIDECALLARKSGRDVAGLVAVTITIQTDPIIDARLALDPDNTVTDPEVLECLRENPLAIVEDYEKLRAADGTLDGPITMQVKHPLQPAQRIPLAGVLPELETVFAGGDSPSSSPPGWPPDDGTPTCPIGTTLAGAHGTSEWCQRPDGTKHGPQYDWDKNRLVVVRTYDNGDNTHATIRSPDR